jgi:uncharacterized membrane protein
MAILLGLAAALLYGGSDFGGGLASRRLGSLTVNAIGSVVGVALVWSVLGLSDGPAPTVRAVVWGVVGGVGGGVGTMMLYRGLARGQMSVVGPVSAVGAAVVPVVVGVVLGNRPGLLAVAGVLVALPAIALVAASGSVSAGAWRSSLFDALAAGTGFGLMFVALAQAGGHAGLWPVATEQTSSLVLLLVVVAVTRTSLKVSVRSLGLPVLAGVTGMAATLLYFAATLQGMLATVAIITSLYPGVTVLLARVVTHERFRTAQRIGLGLCAVAVLAIAVS